MQYDTANCKANSKHCALNLSLKTTLLILNKLCYILAGIVIRCTYETNMHSYRVVTMVCF